MWITFQKTKETTHFCFCNYQHSSKEKVASYNWKMFSLFAFPTVTFWERYPPQTYSLFSSRIFKSTQIEQLKPFLRISRSSDVDTIFTFCVTIFVGDGMAFFFMKLIELEGYAKKHHVRDENLWIWVLTLPTEPDFPAPGYTHFS